MNYYKIDKEFLENKYNFILGQQGYGRHYNIICNTLKSLDFNIVSIGFKYWIDAIFMYNKVKTQKGKMQNIYNTIAEHFDTTPSRVERALRHARETATKTLQEKYNYYGKMSNQAVLELLCNFRKEI